MIFRMSCKSIHSTDNMCFFNTLKIQKTILLAQYSQLMSVTGSLCS